MIIPHKARLISSATDMRFSIRRRKARGDLDFYAILPEQ
jgi:hypothetical protein